MRPGVVSVAAALALLVPAHAQVVRQLTDEKTTVGGPGALPDSGTAVYIGTSADRDGANPKHTFEIVCFDPATGAATKVTSAADGVSALVSVSDDGQWIAFPSPSDLTGGNHDQSIELFVMDSTGAAIRQLTNDPRPNAGSVSLAAMSGNGAKVVFLANTDPLGLNPGNRAQMFIVNRDGTGLAQLTQFTSGGIGGVSISDDGTRIAFGYDGDPFGTNPDLGGEVFAINADGTGLRQMTTTGATFDSGSASLSGGGQKIAFESNGDLIAGTNPNNQTEIFVVDWTGANLRKLTTTSLLIGLLGDPASTSPSITDDGVWVFYSSNQAVLFPPTNLDGSFEIYKIRTDGTGRAALTNSILAYGSLFPTVAGGGGRVTYFSVDLSSVKIEAMDGSGGAKRTLLTFDLTFNGDADVAPHGDDVVYIRTQGLLASGELWRARTDGTGSAPITNFGAGNPAAPSIAGDGSTIVFSSSYANGSANADESTEIFRIQADGTGLLQLTSGAADTSCSSPTIAENGALVVFDCNGDLTGVNADLSREIFRVNADGTGLQQLTSGPLDSTSQRPRVDASGIWLVFESNVDLDGGNPDLSYEIYRVRADGTGLQRITSGAAGVDSRSPDISGAGDRIVFSSTGDPAGTNPEGDSEIFVYEPATATLRQLTAFAAGGSGGARITGDGAWVYFSSSAPIFETDPDEPSDLYRVPAAGGAIERVGALRAGLLSIGIGGFSFGGGSVAVDRTGNAVAFSGIGDFTEQNKDLLPELWVIDRRTPPSITVGQPDPTELWWQHESGPLRYDIVRGDVSQLGWGAGGDVDLGTVVCVENDSPDADTRGFGDARPAVGHAYFYLYRGSQGLAAGPGSYGRSSAGGERRASGGDCAQ